MSVCAFPSPSTRLLATLEKATKRPSWERAGTKLWESPCRPAESTLTRSVETPVAGARSVQSGGSTASGPPGWIPSRGT
jgi:hypothetical protein